MNASLHNKLKPHICDINCCSTGCIVRTNIFLLGQQLDQRLDKSNMFNSSNCWPNSCTMHTTLPTDRPTGWTNYANDPSVGDQSARGYGWHRIIVEYGECMYSLWNRRSEWHFQAKQSFAESYSLGLLQTKTIVQCIKQHFARLKRARLRYTWTWL